MQIKPVGNSLYAIDKSNDPFTFEGNLLLNNLHQTQELTETLKHGITTVYETVHGLLRNVIEGVISKIKEDKATQYKGNYKQQAIDAKNKQSFLISDFEVANLVDHYI